MLLYHGSNQAVKIPKVAKPQRGLDFGSGFYLTPNSDQAKRFSKIIKNRFKTGIPTVSVYEYDELSAQTSLQIAVFSSPNREWLEFVRDNRLKSYDGPQYDVIIGPVANDRVFPTIQALVMMQFTVEAALVALRPFKLFTQYCLATEKALSVLRFVNFLTLEESADA
ncbi:MAG: DUF3990 domain-containing protein [Deltaproteobacteria bacterium]|jgi:hypothetical protein|nr:DUF3990 domain-containing protein [Deltaproteobacteria bacterium]